MDKNSLAHTTWECKYHIRLCENSYLKLSQNDLSSKSTTKRGDILYSPSTESRNSRKLWSKRKTNR